MPRALPAWHELVLSTITDYNRHHSIGVHRLDNLPREIRDELDRLWYETQRHSQLLIEEAPPCASF